MSAVAIQFDPTFSMGPRSAYAWTETMETSSSHNFGQDFSSMLPAVSESGIASPTSSRSMTGSPPRTILTPEQRELKRQRDRARRDSRVSARMHRTNSNSYISSPTLSMTDVTSAMSLPVYTTAPASVSLLGGPSMAGQSYLPPYSPPLHDHSHAFTSHYQQPLQQGYSLPMEYTTSYAPHSDYSIRPTSLPTMGQDGGMMYPVPSGMTQNNPASSSPSASASPSASGPEGSHVRVVQSRPKPRCWEHGCNGRQFSTFSNLLRHQREKSGQAAKATCPNCGAEFTRTTARNGHLLHDKCKQRQNV